ncbi:MAG: hypothetical protein PHT69_14275 [Bacteroidales bacterium]|nr:hypothetical protein [Bacteroidales bacterium]
MKTNKIIIDTRPKIKIQLDHKTFLTIRSMDSFNLWKERYPLARIIE